jgi:hypothetical protein
LHDYRTAHRRGCDILLNLFRITDGPTTTTCRTSLFPQPRNRQPGIPHAGTCRILGPDMPHKLASEENYFIKILTLRIVKAAKLSDHRTCRCHTADTSGDGIRNAHSWGRWTNHQETAAKRQRYSITAIKDHFDVAD